jgi:hypothetical protein
MQVTPVTPAATAPPETTTSRRPADGRRAGQERRRQFTKDQPGGVRREPGASWFSGCRFPCAMQRETLLRGYGSIPRQARVVAVPVLRRIIPLRSMLRRARDARCARILDRVSAPL